MEIYTIGFTQTTAERFFGRLADAGVKRLLDVRLNNSSQLAGFAKAQDLPFFLRRLVGADYRQRSGRVALAAGDAPSRRPRGGEGRQADREGLLREVPRALVPSRPGVCAATGASPGRARSLTTP